MGLHSQQGGKQFAQCQCWLEVAIHGAPPSSYHLYQSSMTQSPLMGKTCNQRWKVEIWLIVFFLILFGLLRLWLRLALRSLISGSSSSTKSSSCNFRLYTCAIDIQIGLYSMIDCDLFETAWIILIWWDYNLQKNKIVHLQLSWSHAFVGAMWPMMHHNKWKLPRSYQ